MNNGEWIVVRVACTYINLEVGRSPAELVLVYATPHGFSGASRKEEGGKEEEGACPMMFTFLPSLPSEKGWNAGASRDLSILTSFSPSDLNQQTLLHTTRHDMQQS